MGRRFYCHFPLSIDSYAENDVFVAKIRSSVPVPERKREAKSLRPEVHDGHIRILLLVLMVKSCKFERWMLM